MPATRQPPAVPVTAPTAAVERNTATPSGLARLDFIDALRGFAVLGVILVHVHNYQPPPGYLETVCSSGMYGVQLFYIVSAATLFLSYHHRKAEAHATLNYFIRRLFRIAPLFYAAIIAFVLVDGWGPRFFAPGGIRPRHVLATAAFANGWFPTYINSVVPGGWSVAVETNFYLLCPLLFLLIRNLEGALAFFFFALVLAMKVNPLAQAHFAPMFPADQQSVVTAFLYFWLPNQLAIFALGTVVYFLFRRLSAAGPSRSRSLLFLSAFLFLSGSLTQGVEPLPFAHEVNWGIALAFFALGLASYSWTVLVNRVTVYIGRISYSVYLTQFLGIYFFQRYCPSIFSGTPSLRRYVLAYACVAAFAIALSTVTYYLIEVPGQKIGKALIAYLERSRGSWRVAHG